MLESFEDFMERMLYDEDRGYYVHAKHFGAKGDFYTSVHLGKLFGYTFANFFIKLYGNYIDLLEVGAGEGLFKDDVIEYFERRKITYRYYILERNRLNFTKARRIASLEEIAPFRGIIFQNEVLDAIPFRRFIYLEDGWHELMVEDESKFVVGEKVSLDILPEGVQEGTIYDVSLKALELLRKEVETLQEGYIVVVDYGYEREELLRRFPKGSLTVYSKHIVSDDVFSNKFAQDITYFVDWTLIREYMLSLGMELMYEGSQGSFLLENGILEIYEEMVKDMDVLSSYRLGNSLKSLIYDFPNFKVQVWRKLSV